MTINSPKIRNKNLIPLLLGKVCRTHTAFCGTKHNNEPSPPRPPPGGGCFCVLFFFFYILSSFVPPLGGEGLPLSQLQCYNGQNRQHYTDNPEPGYNFCFMKTFFLVMMMQRCQ